MKSILIQILFLLIVLIAKTPNQVLAEDCEDAAKLINQGIKLSDGSAAEISAYKEAIRKCPAMPEAYYNLGLVLSKKGELAESLINLGKALELRDSPNFNLAYAHALVLNKDYLKAKLIYQKFIEDEDFKLEALIGLAHIMSLEGKADEATEKLFKAKDLAPQNQDVLYNLAVLLERANRLDEALLFYESTISINSENYEALQRAGLVSLQLNECSRGIKYLEKAAAINPEDADTLRAVGVCYERVSQYERAEIALKKALTLEPNDVATSVNLAIVLIKTQREFLAEEVLLKVEESKRTQKLNSALGWAQLELGKYKSAEHSLKLALKELSSDEIAKNNLETLYKRTGRESEISELFEGLKAIPVEKSEEPQTK
ncbi:MAG: tetratricopeptide repeat protein [Bdellovibrionota bacterium]